MQTRVPKHSVGIFTKTCIQRPPKGSNKSGLFQQVVFKYRFYKADLQKVVVSEEWSLKAVVCLIQVVSNPGLTVLLNLNPMI